MSDTVSLVIVKGTFALLLFGSVVTWALVSPRCGSDG